MFMSLSWFRRAVGDRHCLGSLFFLDCFVSDDIRLRMGVSSQYKGVRDIFESAQKPRRRFRLKKYSNQNQKRHHHHRDGSM